jgi:hypothetical protein
LVAAFNGERSPSSGFWNYPWPQLPATNSRSLQQLNLSGYLTHSPTDSTPLTDFTNRPAYNIVTRTVQKTPFLCCDGILATEICKFAEPLPVSGCFIVAYFVIVPQYKYTVWAKW